MSDESGKNIQWSIALVGRLCLFGWISLILYECFDFIPWMRNIFLAVGPWVCLLAFLHALVFLFLYRQGIFVVFMIISFIPTVYFGIVLNNIVNHQISQPVNTQGVDPPVEQKE